MELSRFRWSALLLTPPLVLVAGCISPGLPSAGRGAPAAHVVRASQYAFTTDFKIDREDPIVDELVKMRDVISDSLRIPLGNQVVRVIIFENKQRFEEYLHVNYPDLPSRRAFFVKQAGGELVIFACRGDNLADDLRHEATHALLHSTLPIVPLWLDEGLAEYFEAGIGNEGRNVWHAARLRAATRAGWRPDLERLEALDDLRDMSAADYREAWLWVHFCLHHDEDTRRVLIDYLAELRDISPSGPAPNFSNMLRGAILQHDGAMANESYSAAAETSLSDALLAHLTGLVADTVIADESPAEQTHTSTANAAPRIWQRPLRP